MTTPSNDLDPVTTAPDTESKHDIIHTDTLKEKPDPDADFMEDNARYNSVHGDLGIVKTLITFKWACACAFLAGLGAMSDGYQYSLPGNLLPNPGFIRQFGVPGLGPDGSTILDPNHVAAWGGMYTGAYIVVLAFGSLPADYFGRKACLFACQFFLAIGCLNELLAKDWTHWMVSKIWPGIAIGLNQCSATAYMSEVTPTNARGAMLGAYQLLFALGQFFSSIAVQTIAIHTPEEYRRGLYSQFVFGGLATVGLFLIPESPRWYVARGKIEQARKSLLRLNGKVRDYNVDHELAILSKEVADGQAMTKDASTYSVWEVLKGTNLRRTFISFFPFAWQQWIGVPVIFGYTAYFFQLSGVAEPFTATVCIQLVLVVGVCASFFLVERIGRRPLLLVNATIMVVCLFVVGGLTRSLPVPSATGSGLIFLSCLWVAAYSISVGPLGYVYLAETSTVLLRAKTTSTAAMGTGLLNLVVNYCTPLMLNAPGFGVSSTAFLYGGTGFIGLVICYFFVPETKGRSFLELDELFERRTPARKFRTTETSVDINRREEMERGRV